MPAADYEPYDLQIEETPAGWRLTLGGEALLTVVGQHPVHHPTRDLLDRIVDEFRAYPTLSVNDQMQIVEPHLQESYWFLGFQRGFR